MAHGWPDWVTPVLVNVLVANEPIPTTPSNEAAAGGVGRYSGTAQTYQTVVSWTVTTGRVGELKEIAFTSSLLAFTHWKVEIGSTVFMTDQLLDASLWLPFGDLKLAAGTLVKVSCKSTDGSSITVNASIVGKEIY